MGDHSKGTKTNDSLDKISDWCLLEAECVDSVDTLSELFEGDTASNISNLIEDLDVDEGNSLALYNSQVTDECNRSIAELKRKFIASPVRSVADLSPSLQAVHISPQRQSKRRLFYDSGICDETTNSITQVDNVDNVITGKDNQVDEFIIMHSSNRRALLLHKFKEKFNVPFTELTRSFKSDKTCTNNWVLAAFGIAEELLEASKTVLQQYCEFLQVIPGDFCALYALEFKNIKNRETVFKLFTSVLNAKEEQFLCDPPKNRSMACALYFYKKAIANIGFKYGAFPQWISTQTVINHQLASAESFKLSEMIQWAYDNDYTDEAAIAYHYALYAEENTNAAAFLQSNQQFKYVRDCCYMVRMYKKQEIRNMTMSAWIFKCCKNYAEGDDWKIIIKLLRYQGINIISFLIALKQFFKNIPKKSCIVIYGPSDTGKSYFCFTLTKFLQGRVVSFMNKNSQFWLTPLLETKIGFLDDATHACWSFLDTHMRNAFDGNQVSVDVKHKALQQVKLPPMLMTTNVDVPKEPTLMYLSSRLTCFQFANKMPFDDNGDPLFNITNDCWAMFFRKFSTHLDLLEEEADGDTGDTDRPFYCTARNSIDSN